jgi:hypothetical protein
VPTTVAAEIFHTEGITTHWILVLPHAILAQDCMGVSHGILNFGSGAAVEVGEAMGREACCVALRKQLA